MNKNTKTNRTCQQESQTKKKKPFLRRDNHRIISNCQAALKRMRRKSKRAANFLIEIAHKREGHKWSREVIGKKFGISESTVKRLIKQLTDLALIISINLYSRPNSYLIGPACSNAFIRQSLMKYLPALGLLLNAIFLSSQPANDPHIYNRNYQENSVPFVHKKKKVSGEYSSFVRSYLEFIEAQPDDWRDSSDNVHRRSSMIVEKSMFIPVVEDLSSVVLSAHGKAKMSAFPTQAVIEADRSLVRALKHKTVTNPFGYLYSVATNWCTTNNRKPNHELVLRLMKDHGLTESTPKIETIKNPTEQTSRSLDGQSAMGAVNADRPGACCHYAHMDEAARAIYLKKQLGGYKLDDHGRIRPNSSHYLEKLACKPGCSAYSENAPKSDYETEQAELPNLTREQKKARIAPALEDYKKLSPAMQKLLVSQHPFRDAQELIDAMLNGEPSQPQYTQEELDAWAPIADTLAAMPLEARTAALAKHDFQEYLPLVENLIASTLSKTVPAVDQKENYDDPNLYDPWDA